jgi:hypothetical protein
MLGSAFTLASLDGGHLRDVMRASLLELASLYVHAGRGGGAAACLRHAHAIAACRDTLLQVKGWWSGGMS